MRNPDRVTQHQGEDSDAGFTGDFFDGQEGLRRPRKRIATHEEGKAAIERARRILDRGNSEREVEQIKRDLGENQEARDKREIARGYGESK